MKRVIITAVTTAAIFLCAHRSASATAEFCPAMLAYQRTGPEAPSTNAPSSVYALELTAYGPRTLTPASLAFDTSAGWYTLNVPFVAIAEKDRRYSAPWVKFTRRDFVSPVFYVRFPQALEIEHAWVASAFAKDGDEFGWQSRGTVQCDPYPESSPEQWGRIPSLRKGSPYTLDPQDDDRISAPPTSASMVLAAQSSAPLESATCGEPFRVATVKTQAVPHYPQTIVRPADRVATDVEVAINSDGTLADAWVWGPSGFSAFDDVAVRAARASTYTGSSAYCKPVPGFYFFRVTFVPN